MIKPEPDEEYRKMQAELVRLFNFPTPVDTQQEQREWRNVVAKLRKAMEARFKEAWHFPTIRHGRPWRNKLEHHQRRLMVNCSYYRDQADRERRTVIVSQPYGRTEEEFRTNFADKGYGEPLIISAPEWAFYYPGQAGLFGVAIPLELHPQPHAVVARGMRTPSSGVAEW